MTTEEGEQFAKEHGLVFLETSAKTAHNVEEVNSPLFVTSLNFTFACTFIWGTFAPETSCFIEKAHEHFELILS